MRDVTVTPCRCQKITTYRCVTLLDVRSFLYKYPEAEVIAFSNSH